MKERYNKTKATNMIDGDRMRALYDKAPYPEVLEGKMSQNTTLLEHWINAVVAPKGIGLHPQGNLLFAGCGSGTEALVLARQYPEATVVGVDFSERSITRAKELAKASNLTNVTFEVADLTKLEWCNKYEPFDFVLCHGVADYVMSPSAMMRTFAACLAPSGVLCMTVNSPHHPAKRIQKAFEELGIASSQFDDSLDQRALLQMVDGLMGTNAGIYGIGNAPKAYLDVDIFPPIAHHISMERWCTLAKEAGLFFCGSMDAPVGVTQLSDEQLPLLYALGKPALSQWMASLCRRPGMQLLFSLQKIVEPNFEEVNELMKWQPKLASCIGQLPEMGEKEPNHLLPITLRFSGLSDFTINSTAYDLEVLRKCDGLHSIEDIIESISVDGNLEALRVCLFRAYHFGLLA